MSSCCVSNSVSKAFRWVAVGAACSCVASVAVAGDPFAVDVVDYVAGSGTIPDFNDASAALGSATRYTGELTPFPGVVSPFNPAFGEDEIVSVGFGGSLTLRFDTVIRDSASNAFGIDFIVFGNAGFIDTNFPGGEVGSSPAMFGVGAEVRVEASADGTEWFDVQTRHLDLFPTLGYRDSSPFDEAAGSDLTDFRTAMDPSLGLDDLAGLDYAGLVDVYGQSGGGVGFDLAGSGLAEASFIRLSYSGAEGETFEIDAVSVVPGPGSSAFTLAALLGATRRRRLNA